MNEEFIGDVRRRLFVDHEDEWNGVVREITASLEFRGEQVDASRVCAEIAKFYRSRAHRLLAAGQVDALKAQLALAEQKLHEFEIEWDGEKYSFTPSGF